MDLKCQIGEAQGSRFVKGWKKNNLFKSLIINIYWKTHIYNFFFEIIKLCEGIYCVSDLIPSWKASQQIITRLENSMSRDYIYVVRELPLLMIEWGKLLRYEHFSRLLTVLSQKVRNIESINMTTNESYFKKTDNFLIPSQLKAKV